jgi:hypothetical protein
MDQPLKFGFIPVEGSAYYPEFIEEVLSQLLSQGKVDSA